MPGDNFQWIDNWLLERLGLLDAEPPAYEPKEPEPTTPRTRPLRERPQWHPKLVPWIMGGVLWVIILVMIGLVAKCADSMRDKNPGDKFRSCIERGYAAPVCREKIYGSYQSQP